MSDVMMAVLQGQVESLTRQVKQLAPENERVRKLLTEFDRRHDQDQARIEALEAENARLTAERDAIALQFDKEDDRPALMARIIIRSIENEQRAITAEAQLTAERANADRLAAAVGPFSGFVDRKSCEIVIIWADGKYRSTYTGIVKPDEFFAASDALAAHTQHREQGQ